MQIQQFNLNASHWAEQASVLGTLPETVVMAELKDLQSQHPGLLQKLFPELPVEQGFLFYIPKNVRVKEVIHVSFSKTEVLERYHLIYLEEGAEFNLFEEYLGANTVLKTVVHLEANAKLNYYKLQAESEGYHKASMKVVQARDSLFKSTLVSLGAQNSHDQLMVHLHEKNAQCELRAFCYASQQQVIEHHTMIEHLSGHCLSQQHYKTIAQDKARVAFRGRVKVHPQAQRTNAQQFNQNLLLSSQAEVDAKPELEIYADDVKCSHGSTVGQLDEDALFYLRSRGIKEADAQHLLSCAFAMSILDEISHEGVAQHLRKWAIDSLSNTNCCGACHDQ